MATAPKKFGPSTSKIKQTKKSENAEITEQSIHTARFTKLHPYDLSKLQVSRKNSRDTTFLVRYINDDTLAKMKAMLVKKHSHLDGNEVAIIDYLTKHIGEFTDPDSDLYVNIKLNATIAQYKYEQDKSLVDKTSIINGILDLYDHDKEGIFIGKSLITFNFSNHDLVKLATQFKDDISRLQGVVAKGRKFQDDITIKEEGSRNIICGGFLRYSALFLFYGSEHTVHVKKMDDLEDSEVTQDEYIFIENNSKTNESGWETFMMRSRVYQQNSNKSNNELMSLVSLSRNHFYKQLPMLQSSAIYEAVVSKQITHYSLNKVIGIFKKYEKDKVEIPTTVEGIKKLLEAEFEPKPQQSYNQKLASEIFIDKDYHKLTHLLDRQKFTEEDIKDSKKLAKRITALFTKE